MGGRGRKSGQKNRQTTLDNVIERNIIADTIEASFKRREAKLDTGIGGGSKSPLLLKKCACCGEYTIPVNTQYETCPVCGWIDDKKQNSHPDSVSGRNPMCLKEARKIFFAENNTKDDDT